MQPIPYFQQETDYTCGAACLRMILAASDRPHSEAELAKLLDSQPKVGVDNSQLCEVARKLGYEVLAKDHGTITEVQQLLDADYAIIANFMGFTEEVGHFALVLAIENDQVVLHDPWNGPEFRVGKDDFVNRWHNTSGDRPHWFVALRPLPEE